jgi:hypothetical protein
MIRAERNESCWIWLTSYRRTGGAVVDWESLRLKEEMKCFYLITCSYLPIGCYNGCQTAGYYWCIHTWVIHQHYYVVINVQSVITRSTDYGATSL